MSFAALRDKWLDYITVKRKLIPLSILRIGYGSLLLAYFVMLWPERDFFFSNLDGYYPDEYISTKSRLLRSLLQAFDSYVFLDALLLIGIAGAACFTVGFLTKPAHALLYASYFLLEGRNPLIFDAGDDFVQLSLLYLLFCRMNAHFSVDRRLSERRKEREPEKEWAAVLHNFGVFAAIAQFLLIYLISDAAKVLGGMWRRGTALYYASYADFFNLIDPVTELLRSHLWISQVMSYAVMLFQLVFAALVFIKKTRPWILAAAVAFHAGIAAHFGLVYFSLIMIVFDVMFFSDEEWRAWGRKMRRRFAGPERKPAAA